jgi:hypothetical protein
VTASIPLWVPLVVAILGLIGTAGGAIAGVVITQRRSDARDKTAWERERERWTREDAARTFELRREAYIEFYTAVSAQRADFDSAYLSRHERKPTEARGLSSFDIEFEVHRAQEKVRVYGSSVVVEVAERMGPRLIGTRKMLNSGGPTEANLAALKRGEVELLRVIRADLGIPAGTIEKAEG